MKVECKAVAQIDCGRDAQTTKGNAHSNARFRPEMAPPGAART